MRYNPHKINCIYWKCEIWGFEYVYPCEITMKAVNTSIPKCPAAHLCPLLVPLTPHPRQSLICLLHCRLVLILKQYKWGYVAHTLISISDFVQSAWLFWDLSMLFCVSILHSFFLLSSFLLYTTGCSPIHLLMNIWVPYLAVENIKKAVMNICVCMDTDFFFLWGKCLEVKWLARMIGV